MRYADHVKQLLDHAARTSIAADWAITAWLAGPTDSACVAAETALTEARDAQRDLRRTVRKIVRAQLTGTQQN